MQRLLPVALSLLLAPLAAQGGTCLDSFGQSNNRLVGVTMGGPNLSVGIRLQNGRSAIQVEAIEVFSGGAGGASALAIWSHDAAGNRPATQLASGSFTLSRTIDWQGARLTSPVALAAGQTFWLVWEPVNGCVISAEQRNASGEFYRGSFDGGRSWNGPFQAYDWKYRMWCNGYQPGGFETFGSACAGSGRTSPRIGATAIPRVGVAFDMTVANALPNASAFAALGASDTLWAGSIPLPQRLDPFGAPGCVIWIDLLATAPAVIDSIGEARLPIVLPNDPSLIGLTVFGQWLVQDSVNALGFVTSDAARLTIGG